MATAKFILQAIVQQTREPAATKTAP